MQHGGYTLQCSQSSSFSQGGIVLSAWHPHTARTAPAVGSPARNQGWMAAAHGPASTKGRAGSAASTYTPDTGLEAHKARGMVSIFVYTASDCAHTPYVWERAILAAALWR